MDILDKLGLIGLIPVVVIEDLEDAIPAAQALLEAGIEAMEITLRTDAALDSIRQISETAESMLVGAGTVLSHTQCQEAIDAGAQFIVTPGFNPPIVDHCQKMHIPIVPGCVTPTEIDQALAYGVKIVKFFPASVYGGVDGCQALYGPYRAAGVKFVPTGGISLANLADYADKPFIHATGGGWLCSQTDLSAKDYDQIKKTAKLSIDRLLGLEAVHIPPQNESDSILGLVNLVEMCQQKSGFLKDEQPIKIRTLSLDRTLFYLGEFATGWKTSYVDGLQGPETLVILEENGRTCFSLQQK